MPTRLWVCCLPSEITRTQRPRAEYLHDSEIDVSGPILHVYQNQKNKAITAEAAAGEGTAS
jgi:hypothetical protein